MNDCEKTDSGVLYIAFGERWREEARQSLKSLRNISVIPAAVVTDAPWTGAPQPERFIRRDPVAGFASKPVYMGATPFHRTLFLDTDTFIAKDVAPVFGLLNHYDIGVHFFGPMLKMDPDLFCHPQCSSGVILYKNNDAVREVFRLWNETYCAAVEERVATDRRGLGDQRYLAIAIALSNARAVHLGAYLNFMLIEPMITQSPPMVLHGRARHPARIVEEINGRWDPNKDCHPRLWLPNIRGLLPAGIRRSDPLLAAALLLRRAWNDVRRRICSWLKP